MAEPVEGLLPDPVPDHPLLNGRKEIGRGESTIVLEAPTVDDQERVYKVLSSPTDYAYYTLRMSRVMSATSSPMSSQP